MDVTTVSIVNGDGKQVDIDDGGTKRRALKPVVTWSAEKKMWLVADFLDTDKVTEC